MTWFLNIEFNTINIHRHETGEWLTDRPEIPDKGNGMIALKPKCMDMAAKLRAILDQWMGVEALRRAWDAANVQVIVQTGARSA